jgi:hypothetical protein
MAATRSHQPTNPRSSIALKYQSLLLFGKHGALQSANFSHGSSFKIGFGFQTDWREETGTTTLALSIER